MWVVATGAQLRPEEEARGQGGRTPSSGLRPESYTGVGVATRLYRGQEFKHLSIQGLSGPLDQEVKTKLILELVIGSDAHGWANTREIK